MTSISEIKDAGKKWKQALESGNPDAVVDLYHDNAVLWGTLSDNIRRSHKAIREYFEKFTALENIRVDFSGEEIRIYNDFSINSGYYVFSWLEGEKKVEIPARYSFVYKKNNDQWYILDHHSSIKPDLPFNSKKYIKPWI